MTRVGENTVRISPDDIRHPSGVTVTYLSPSEIRVKLEAIERKTIRLKPVLRGVPAGGYRLAKIAVDPPRVTVEGPASVIRSLEDLETMPIDIQGAKDDITVDPKIDYRGRQVKILEKNITVRMSVERAAR
jgi:YbbR domain-containing protein